MEPMLTEDSKTCFLSGLRCVICENPLVEPRQVSCGDRVCTGCYHSLLANSTENFRCKRCGSEVSTNESFRDRAVEGDLARTSFCCPYSNCQWNGRNLSYKDHIAQCEYAPVRCPNVGCDFEGLKCDLDCHQNACPSHPVKCECCEETFPRSQLQDHLEVSCTGVVVKCIAGCGKDITRKELDYHLRSMCVKWRRPCQYCHFGCEFVGNYEEMTSHEDKATKYHLRCVADALERKFMPIEEESFTYPLPIEVEDTVQTKAINRTALASAHIQEAVPPVQSVDRRAGAMVLEPSLPSHEQSGSLDIGDQGSEFQQDKQHVERKDWSELSGYGSEVGANANLVPSRLTVIPEMVQQVQTSAQIVVPSSFSVPSLSHTCLPSPATLYDRKESAVMEVVLLHRELKTLSEEMSRQLTPLREGLVRLESSITEFQKNFSELALKVQMLQATSYNGTFIWKIPELARRTKEARISKTISLYSAPFFTSRFGYKMCLRLYLNGDGSGKGTFLSFFLTIMRGEYDTLLSWPFQQMVTLMLLDQDKKNNIVQCFRPEPSSSSFWKPKTEMNIASGCPKFAPLSVLNNPSYVRNDTLYLKVMIDKTGLDECT